MNSLFSWIFFAVFAAILVCMYLAIRRQWAKPGFVAAAGVIGSVLSMLLMSVAQGNNALQAVVVGLVVGGLFSGFVLAVAWYFQLKDMRARFADSGQTDHQQAADG
jgi:uncharacterized membrane protein